MTRARRCGARLSESSGRGGAGGRAEPSRSEPLLARRPGGAEGAAASQRTPGPRPSAPGRPHRRAAAPAHVSPRGRAAPAAPVRPLGTSARRERGSDGGSAEPEGKAEPRGSLRLVPAGRCSGLEVAQLGAELAVWRTGSGLSRRCQLPGCLFAASSNISPPPCLVLFFALPGARGRSPFLCRSGTVRGVRAHAGVVLAAARVLLRVRT